MTKKQNLHQFEKVYFQDLHHISTWEHLLTWLIHKQDTAILGAVYLQDVIK